MTFLIHTPDAPGPLAPRQWRPPSGVELRRRQGDRRGATEHLVERLRRSRVRPPVWDTRDIPPAHPPAAAAADRPSRKTSPNNTNSAGNEHKVNKELGKPPTQENPLPPPGATPHGKTTTSQPHLP